MDLLSMSVRAEFGARRIYVIREHTTFEPRRFHGFVLYLAGACEYVYEMSSFVATAGSFLLLPKGLRYSIHPAALDSSCLLINFDADFAGPCRPVFRDLEAPEKVKRHFDMAIQATNRDEQNRRALIFAALYQIIAQVEAPSRYLDSAQRVRLGGAIEALQRDFCRPDLTVGALAKACDISEKYFQQLFKDAYHVSPKQYILSLRLERAKHLLASTDNAIGEIAVSCGFSDLFYFSRAFRNKTQMTPSQWRRQARIT